MNVLIVRSTTLLNKHMHVIFNLTQLYMEVYNQVIKIKIILWHTGTYNRRYIALIIIVYDIKLLRYIHTSTNIRIRIVLMQHNKGACWVLTLRTMRISANNHSYVSTAIFCVGFLCKFASETAISNLRLWLDKLLQ